MLSLYGKNFSMEKKLLEKNDRIKKLIYVFYYHVESPP